VRVQHTVVEAIVQARERIAAIFRNEKHVAAATQRIGSHGRAPKHEPDGLCRMRHPRQVRFGRTRGHHGGKYEGEMCGDAPRLGVVLRSNRFDPLSIVRIEQRKGDDRPNCAVSVHPCSFLNRRSVISCSPVGF
jgi:hypothetical protein